MHVESLKSERNFATSFNMKLLVQTTIQGWVYIWEEYWWSNKCTGRFKVIHVFEYMWLNKIACWIKCNWIFINVPNNEQKICMYSWWFTKTVVIVIQGMVGEVLYCVLSFGWLILLMFENNTVLSWPSGRLSWQLSACWCICLKESNLVTSDWNRLVYTISSPPFTGSPYTICEAH